MELRCDGPVVSASQIERLQEKEEEKGWRRVAWLSFAATSLASSRVRDVDIPRRTSKQRGQAAKVQFVGQHLVVISCGPPLFTLRPTEALFSARKAGLLHDRSRPVNIGRPLSNLQADAVAELRSRSRRVALPSAPQFFGLGAAGTAALDWLWLVFAHSGASCGDFAGLTFWSTSRPRITVAKHHTTMMRRTTPSPYGNSAPESGLLNRTDYYVPNLPGSR